MSGTHVGSDPAGWYDDPAGPGQRRYWSGTGWTSWVWDGTDAVWVPLPEQRDAGTSDESAHLRYVLDRFLPAARAAHVVPPLAIAALADYARDLEQGATRRTPATAGVAAAGATTGPAAPPSRASAPLPVDRTPAPYPTFVLKQPTTTSTAPSKSLPLTPFEPRPYRPGPVARRWDRTRDAVGSDLAANGLAYLGVLLLFVGVFGLVAFAFGDVAEGARPLAELGIALAPFVASWMLLRRGAVIAGRALETAGGLLLPIMLITSFLDGVPVPPDVTGTVLVVTLTTVTALVSASYAWWSSRHAESTLRFLVAPVAWLSAALATTGVGRAVPSGRGVATVTAVQASAIAVAILVSLVWCWARPQGRLSAPTFAATVPALVIVTPIAIVSWAVAGWPMVPIAVTGVTGLLVLELMIGHLRRSVVTTAQPLWWAVVALALVPSMGAAPAAVCAAAGFLALLELESADGASWRTMGISATGLALSLCAVWTEPWWAFAALVPLTAWAHVRRLHPFAAPPAPLLLDLAAGLFPMGVVVALGMATRHAPAAVLIGAMAALVAAWPATRRGRRPLLQRDESDHFWVLWWDAAMVVTIIGAALMAGPAWPDVVSARWMLVAAVAVLAPAAAVGPLPAALRPWVVGALATWWWVLAASMLALPVGVVAVVVATVGLAVVVLVHARPTLATSWQHPGSSAWAGLALGATALVWTRFDLGWGLAVSAALVTASWCAVTSWTALDRSPAVDVLVAVTGAQARWLPGGVAVAAIPTTAVLLLDASTLVPIGSVWVPVVLAVTAVVYAAAARLRTGEVVAGTLTYAACAGALAAPALTTAQLPALVALLALVASVLLLPRDRRPVAMVWFAWASVAPIVALGLLRDTSVFSGISTPLAFAWTVLGVGSVLLVAGMALDLHGRAWASVWRPSRPAYLPVVVLGAAEVLVGVAVATATAPSGTAGLLTAVLVLVLVVTAVLSRAWSLVGAAAAAAWLAVLQLRGDDVLHAPWFPVVVTALLLAGAELAHRLVRDERWWVRTDWLLAAVAHVTAVTALLAAGTSISFALTYLAVGLLALALAARLHHDPVVVGIYAVVGDGLVLAGAASAGPGWLALALAVTSVGCSVLATRVAAVVRWALLVVGAVTALAAWLSVAAWLEWTPAQVVDRTVLLGAGITLLMAVLLRWTAIDRTVVLVRGGLAVLTATLTPLVPLVTHDERLAVTSATAAALAAVGVGLALAARPLGQQALRYAAPAYVLVAAAETAYLLDATPTQQVAALAVATLGCTLALLLPRREAWADWRLPVVSLGVTTSVLSVVVALTQLPDTTLLSPALLVAALMSTSIAVETRSLLAQVVSPRVQWRLATDAVTVVAAGL